VSPASPPPRQTSPASSPPPKTQSFNKEPPKKKQPKKKQAKEAPKLPWDKTYEECCEEAKKAVYNHFKPKKPEKKVQINPADSAFFIKMTDANWKKFILPSNYDCSNTKSYKKKKKYAR
jgi:hypothetical protein